MGTRETKVLKTEASGTTVPAGNIEERFIRTGRLLLNIPVRRIQTKTNPQNTGTS
jgi:hypothetical protein